MSYTYAYPRPAVTVDIALITSDDDQKILLIKRGREPFQNCWALPGGFVDQNEDLEPAAIRELKEETGICCNALEQFKTYGTPGRDPRGHTISVVFVQIVPTIMNVSGCDDAIDAQWFSLDNLPPLAFDHDTIIGELIQAYASPSDSKSS